MQPAVLLKRLILELCFSVFLTGQMCARQSYCTPSRSDTENEVYRSSLPAKKSRRPRLSTEVSSNSVVVLEACLVVGIAGVFHDAYVAFFPLGV